MRKFKVTIETNLVGSECEDFIEVDDNATEKEIEEEAYQCAMNMCEWNYEEVENK